MQNNKPNLNGCIIFSILISAIFTLIAICVFVGILILGTNSSTNNSSLYFSTKNSEGKCEINTNGSPDEMTANVAKYYACDKLKLDSIKLEKWGSENSEKYTIIPYIGGDSTNRKNGRIYAYDLKNFKTLSEIKVNTSVLDVISTYVVDEKYIIFYVGSPTGTTCKYLEGEQFYPFCKFLKQDIKEIGGWYVLDTNTFEITKLFGLE